MNLIRWDFEMIVTKIIILVVVELYETKVHGQITLSASISLRPELASGPILQRKSAGVLHCTHNATTI